MHARTTERMRGRRRAFTLIELLVVMGVIAILMTLLVPTLGAIRRQANITRAHAIIHGVSMALDAYKSVHHMYPPDKGTTLHANLDKSSECLVYFLSGMSIAYDPSNPPPNYPWKHSLFQDNSADGNKRRSWKVYYEFKGTMLADGDKDKVPELIGPWMERFIYNTGSTGSSGWNQYGAARHRLGRFDLFSGGPDRKYGTDDDVTNWDDSNSDNYSSLGSGD